MGEKQRAEENTYFLDTAQYDMYLCLDRDLYANVFCDMCFYKVSTVSRQ